MVLRVYLFMQYFVLNRKTYIKNNKQKNLAKIKIYATLTL